MSDWANYPVNATVQHLIKLLNTEKEITDLQQQIIDTQSQTIGHMTKLREYDKRNIEAMKPYLKRPYRGIFKDV
jgi:hypothetical protein